MTPFDPLALQPGHAVFPVVISGPSGVGKTVLINRLLQREEWLVRSVSATSRPPRGGEQDGVHYYFHTIAEMEALIAGGGLAEWARVHDHYYGTPLQPLDQKLAAGRAVALNIDVQGGRQLRQVRPQTLLIFLVPPSMEVLERRLRERATDSEETIATRLRNAREELDQARHYDYLVVNAELEQAVEEVRRIVLAERHRVARLSLVAPPRPC